MKFIVENGPTQFKIGLVKNSQGVRDAASKFDIGTKCKL